MRGRIAIAVAGALLLTLMACEYDVGTPGPLKEDPITIDRGQADHANVELDMGAGELELAGGAQKLLEGQFAYNVAEWKPEVRSSVGGSHATVTIKEPEHVRLGGRRRYDWDLKLNDDVEMDLTLNCGAGQARLDLGDLDLRNVAVHMGAGQVDLDLRGHPKRDYEVSVQGGVGQATVHLPEGIGVRAEAHGGLGSIDVTGLEKRGDHWENNLYDNAKVNLRLQVEGGIGEIRIIG